jgi:phosphatidylserine/phosphatidylglycerophosphate/cardiolipin synthase-like enzyme
VKRTCTARTLLIAVLGLTVTSTAPAREATFGAQATYEALYTPGDAIDRRIEALIDAARSEVAVQAFSFTNRRIAQALVNAQRRGVRVSVQADRAQALETPGTVVPTLVRAGVPVWLEGRFAAAHDKVVVIDADSPEATLITGSYNFTMAAQLRNAENVLIVRHDAALAQRYRVRMAALREGAQRLRTEDLHALSFAP